MLNKYGSVLIKTELIYQLIAFAAVVLVATVAFGRSRGKKIDLQNCTIVVISS